MQNSLQVRVESLFIYPIKSCAGVRIPHLCFNAEGAIKGDREWVVVDANGDVVWQGSHPRLALVRPAIRDAMLVVTAPGMAAIEIALEHSENACEMRIWNDTAKISEPYLGFEAGPEACALLRAATGENLRLVRLGQEAMSRTGINPVHVSSVPSLYELNEFLISQGNNPAEIARFRPNIVLDGIDEILLPFIEEQFTFLRWRSDTALGQIDVYGRCERCIMPNVDPETAVINEEPGPAVAKLSAQRYPGQPSYFGIYGRTRLPAMLAEGCLMDADLQL